eukprot:6182415-Pleurochrysis_carterae.AAC.3
MAVRQRLHSMQQQPLARLSADTHVPETARTIYSSKTPLAGPKQLAHNELLKRTSKASCTITPAVVRAFL